MSTQPAIFDEHADVLPRIDDIDFLTKQSFPPESDMIFQASKAGMWSQMAYTINIFRRTTDMISKLGLNVRTVHSYRDEISQLARELDEWLDNLPPELQYSSTNISHFANAGLGRTFLAMHMGYHHYQQLLYYPFLNLQTHQGVVSDSVDALSDHACARACKKHAMAISDIIKTGSRTSNSSLLYFLTGHILVVSSSVHLHTLLFEEDEVETSAARERLVSNFEILMLLKMYWPVIDSSVCHKSRLARTMILKY